MNVECYEKFVTEIKTVKRLMTTTGGKEVAAPSPRVKKIAVKAYEHLFEVLKSNDIGCRKYLETYAKNGGLLVTDKVVYAGKDVVVNEEYLRVKFDLAARSVSGTVVEDAFDTVYGIELSVYDIIFGSWCFFDEEKERGVLFRLRNVPRLLQDTYLKVVLSEDLEAESLTLIKGLQKQVNRTFYEMCRENDKVPPRVRVSVYSGNKRINAIAKCITGTGLGDVLLRRAYASVIEGYNKNNGGNNRLSFCDWGEEGLSRRFLMSLLVW